MHKRVYNKKIPIFWQVKQFSENVWRTTEEQQNVSLEIWTANRSSKIGWIFFLTFKQHDQFVFGQSFLSAYNMHIGENVESFNEQVLLISEAIIPKT